MKQALQTSVIGDIVYIIFDSGIYNFTIRTSKQNINRIEDWDKWVESLCKNLYFTGGERMGDRTTDFLKSCGGIDALKSHLLYIAKVDM